MNDIPAFPRERREPEGFPWDSKPGSPGSPGHDGMTLRDYFAAKAISSVYRRGTYARDISKEAYEIADAMLKERVRP